MQNELDLPFEIVSVRSVKPPPDTDGTGWCKYEISQGGENVIRGFRQGDPTTVTGALKQIVEQMNERRMGKRGRVNLVPTPKKK